MSLRHRVTWAGLQANPLLLQHDLENTKAGSEDLARHHDDHWAGRPNRLSTVFKEQDSSRSGFAPQVSLEELYGMLQASQTKRSHPFSYFQASSVLCAFAN